MALYVATCGPYVKVGTSWNPAMRIAQLNRPSGRAGVLCPADLPDVPVVLVASMKGGYGTEYRLIRALKALGAHVVGEWFLGAPEVYARIFRRADVEALAQEMVA